MRTRDFIIIKHLGVAGQSESQWFSKCFHTSSPISFSIRPDKTSLLLLFYGKEYVSFQDNLTHKQKQWSLNWIFIKIPWKPRTPADTGEKMFPLGWGPFICILIKSQMFLAPLKIFQMYQNRVVLTQNGQAAYPNHNTWEWIPALSTVQYVTSHELFNLFTDQFSHLQNGIVNNRYLIKFLWGQMNSYILRRACSVSKCPIKNSSCSSNISCKEAKLKGFVMLPEYSSHYTLPTPL